jgi:hypothetical protein
VVVAVVGIHPDKLAEPMSKQPIAPAAIRKVIADNTDDVLACYQPALGGVLIGDSSAAD